MSSLKLVSTILQASTLKRSLIRCASGSTTRNKTPSSRAVPEELRYGSGDKTTQQPASLPLLPLENIHALSHRAETNLQNVTGIAFRRTLFTPGPLMVSERVKAAMMSDMGKRHSEFNYVVTFVRKALLQVAKVSPSVYTTILLNGSGTFATEATLKTIFGQNKKKLLVMENGMYGRRIAELSKSSGINVQVIPVNLKKLEETLKSGANDIGGVIVVHCETSTGKINPIHEIGEMVKQSKPECLYFVDAMTSFAAIPINMKNIDFLMSNSCKSLQGVPGVSFTIAKRDMLEKHRGKNVGLVLDIGAQHDEMERTGQFRFTPPTHVMCGLKECLLEYLDEGGLAGRSQRYRKNTMVLKEEMRKMGFQQLFKDSENPDGYIITSFLYPRVPQFVFKEFYKRLSDAGHVISPEKSTAINCFRVGSIGNLYEDDMRALCTSIRDVCYDMRIDLSENLY